jgi:hypothetical protein
VPLFYIRSIIFDFYHLTKWLVPVAVPLGAATPSLAKDVRRASGGTFAAMRHSRNGKTRYLEHYALRSDRKLSRNCTKHQVRCDYMDSPTAMMPESPQSSPQPNLLWTPEIEATIDLWRQTGEFPFPELQVYPQPQWHALSRTDLRLIHHLSTISNEMFRNRTSKSTLWTDMMPK